MFYVSNAIKFSVFLGLLWKFTLFFWTPWANQFDIRALLFGGYARFIPLSIVVHIDNGTPFYLTVHRGHS